MRTLSISFDKKLFEKESESQKRQIMYGDILDSSDIIVLVKKFHNRQSLSDKVTIWPTNSSGKISYFFDAIKLSIEISKQKKIDAVISQDPLFSGLTCFIVSKIIKAKHLTSVFGDNIYDPLWRHESLFHYLLYFVGSFVLQKADAIQADGLKTVDELEKRFPGKVFWKPIIPADIKLFSRPKESHEGINILFVNRLVPQKNIPMLISVIEGIHKRNFSSHPVFTVVGDGPLRDEFAKNIKKRGLESCVRIMGSVSREDLADIMAKQDILISTSNYEGFGRIFADAAISGVPVITTDVGEARNLVIDGEGGFIVPKYDVNNFILKLSEVIDKEDLRNRMSENIKRNWLNNYSPDLTINRQKAVFNYLKNKNILIITQKLDSEDVSLGFFCDWIDVFSRNFGKVYVITLSMGKYKAPNNVVVYSLGREKGASKLLQVLRFYKKLYQLTPKTDGVFAHMAPIFVIASWPIVKIFNKKIILWYTHKSVTLKLKIAEKLSDEILTASKESFRLLSKKVVITGHGIDTGVFTPVNHKSQTTNHKLKILSVGRIAPVKNYEVLISATRILKSEGLDFSVSIVGEPVLDKDKEYDVNIKKLVNSNGLGDVFNFLGKIEHKNLPEVYRNHDIFIHLSRTGSLDKVILEAMACGMTVLSCNEASQAFLPEDYIFGQDNGEEFARRIKFATHNPKSLREFVLNNHNLESLIKKLPSHFQ